MLGRRYDQQQKPQVILHWYLLTLSAGFINAGAFLATGRFVTHTTGFATLFGVDVAEQAWDAAAGIVTVPVFFLLGAFISGYLIDRPLLRKKIPHYDWAMLLAAFSLAIAAGASWIDQISAFGQNFHLKDVYVLLAALCFASGLQNAALTSSSGSSVRTTHLTGITTDLGLGFARLLALSPSQERYQFERYLCLLRSGSILFFILGSVVGAYFFKHFEYIGFLIPAAISLFSALYGRREKQVMRLVRGGL